MSMLLPSAILTRLREQARAERPHECCGLLVGHTRSGHRQIVDAVPSANLAPDSRTHGFLVDPNALAWALKCARALGGDIVGVYHSHPASDALPSRRDEQEATPEWASVILGAKGDVRCWQRSGTGRALYEEPIIECPS
ncbi:MAG: M67 family metallopeptidase [Myxococcota bacterium]